MPCAMANVAGSARLPILLAAGLILGLACSTRFWESASSALLAMGAAFFCSAALIGTLLARRDARW